VSRTVLVVVLLTLVYALTLASLHPLDLALGALLGALASRAVRAVPSPVDRSTGPLLGRVLRFPAFLGGLLVDVVAGTWDVALRALHLRPLERPGIVLVPIEERSGLGVAVSALATTLSPGSLLVDIDWERRVMLIHVIDATDPDGVRARHRRFYDRYQRGVFP
jgi:multisubunit Na+/H+ antiporter MnhE subunit